jgi:DNA-directed RNA polymerase subunit RPC12/RpoP
MQQAPPWEGYGAEGFTDCWSCYRSEPITDDTYIVCFECGHAWTKRALVRTYRRELLRSDGKRWFSNEWGSGRLRVWWRALTVRAETIFFCQKCVHDF